MLYASDHGESFGEKGMYLHGAPYMIAPDEQTHVPAMLWMSAGARARHGADIACLQSRAQNALSHDHLFPTLLELNQISTPALHSDQSILDGCRASQVAAGGT